MYSVLKGCRSTHACLLSQTNLYIHIFLTVLSNYISDNVDLCYSKLLVAPRDFVQNLIDKERVALETQHAEAGVDVSILSYIIAMQVNMKNCHG